MSKKFTDIDFQLMSRALDLAKMGFGKTKPNPMVGAVLVKNNKIIGEGYHHGAGLAHAEVEALRGLPDTVIKGSELYVTLEPCSHLDKRTPPCADLLINKGLKSVIIATKDPNPKVDGRGILLLKKAGINVRLGLCEDQAVKLNEVFFKYVSTPLLFVVVKSALSLDGKIATGSGDSKWISNEFSRRYVHKLRGFYDAVLTSSKTVIADNPHFGVRSGKGNDPLRIVVDRDLITSPLAAVYRDKNVLVVTSCDDKKKRDLFLNAGIELMVYSENFKLKKLLIDLRKNGLQSLMVEAGGKFIAALIREKLVDKFLFFYCPKIIGGEGMNVVGNLGIDKIDHCLKLEKLSALDIKGDILMESYPVYNNF